MKKIIALILAVIMIAAMAIPAFAADVSIDKDNKTGNVTVNYEMTQAYTITIPESIVLSDTAAKTLELSASGVKIPANKALTVTVVSANGYTVTDTTNAGNTAVAYTVKTNYKEFTSTGTVKEITLVNNDTVDATKNVALTCITATVIGTAGDSNSATLTFATAGTSQVGTYSDTLTFTASLENYTVA